MCCVTDERRARTYCPLCLRERAGVGKKVGRVAIEVAGRARLGAERVSRGLGLLVRTQNGTEDPRMDRKGHGYAASRQVVGEGREEGKRLSNK